MLVVLLVPVLMGVIVLMVLMVMVVLIVLLVRGLGGGWGDTQVYVLVLPEVKSRLT